MREELQNKLYEKWPKLLSNLKKNRKANGSPLSWDGIDVGDGWYDIVDTLCKNIVLYSREYNRSNVDKFDCKVQQIKEKFGGLRFYIDGGDNHIHDLISKAENTSEIVCELCGTFDDVGKTDGWITTICQECHSRINDNRHWRKIGD